MQRPSIIRSRTVPPRVSLLAIVLMAGSLLGAAPAANDPAGGKACAGDNGGITLPPGFCATVFADHIGHARHMVVAPNGVLYVNTWSGRYYGNDTPPPGGFLVALQDTSGDGPGRHRSCASARRRKKGSAGGTGIAIYNGALYAEMNDQASCATRCRQAGLAPTGAPETIVSGLPLTGDHPMHPFAIDENGNLFVDVGIGDQFLPARRIACRTSRRQALHGARDPRRHLALRRQQDRAAILPGRALRHRHSQCRGHRHRRRPGWPLTRPSTAAISCPRTGRSSIRPSKAPICRPRSVAGRAGRRLRLAGMLFRQRRRTSLCSRPNMAAMAARRSACAPTRRRPSPPSPPIGRPTISCSTAASSSRRPIATARSSPSTARGTARPSPRRLQRRVPAAQGRQAFGQISSSSPTDLPALTRSRARPRIDHPASRSGPDGSLYISDDQNGRIWRVTFTGDRATTGIEPAPPAETG